MGGGESLIMPEQIITHKYNNIEIEYKNKIIKIHRLNLQRDRKFW